jgi:hypothetical protein
MKRRIHGAVENKGVAMPTLRVKLLPAERISDLAVRLNGRLKKTHISFDRRGIVIAINDVTTDKRARQLGSKLVELVGTVSESMVVGDIVEEFLSIEGTAEEESKVSVRRSDDICYLVDCFATVKGRLVGETILDSIG